MQFQKIDIHHGVRDELHEVVPGVAFGRPEWVLSPAYWLALVQSSVESNLFGTPKSLEAEVCFCLLGGHGVTAEMNIAAYDALEMHGIFDRAGSASTAEIEAALRLPLAVGGRTLRYRFPRQRAHRVAQALTHLSEMPAPASGTVELREYLLELNGVGPKTASWIARNWLGSDDVAILDIHVERAGRKIGLFDASERLPRDYFSMEKKFLAFADALGVEASVLDVAIWSTMRNLGRIAYS